MTRAPRSPHLAFDRSSRSFDQSGHLNVRHNVLTAAGISPYYGRELPGWDKLGLAPDRVYQMLRPADEIRKASSTLAGKPILIEHREVNADAHPHRSVVGAVGSDVAFDGAAVTASLTFWTRDAIDAIEHGGQRSLSCGYFFRPDMTPGRYQGQPFDGVMRSLAYNHVALVVEPRVNGAMVGDSALKRGFNMDDDDKTELLAILAKSNLADSDLLKIKKMLNIEADDDDDDDDAPAMDARLRTMADARKRRAEAFPHAHRLTRA
jgi:hypothetical protein